MAAILQAFMNGKWVEIPALQGEDGFSPTVTVADEGDKITITVEDKNGEKSISYAKGGGDMLKSVYDGDGDGVVDQAERATTATTATKAADADKLGGELPSAYRKKADQIDYQSEIKNKPTIPTVDTAVTAGSANAVSGGAVKTYVDGKETALQTGIDARPTMQKLLIMFPTGGWYNEVDAGIWFKTVSVDAYGNALDLNDATDELFVDVKIPNLYKDEVRAAWAELRDFEITEDGLRANFFAEPTVNITIDAVRLRKEG